MNYLAAGTANVLGALAVQVAGAVRTAVTSELGSGGMVPDALIVIKDQPGRTVDWLSRVLEMSQPGAVHLVRRLAEAGWVERRRGADARSYALHLTPSGKDAAERALRARQRLLDELTARLTAEQRRHLGEIASAVLGPAAGSEPALARVCRLCDRSCCDACPAYAGYLQAAP
jgi:DNA-binding MarR family transcriptional regulator